ncbi:MAG: hypothetical protein AVDCRST_MAG30-2852, partial [uncultured Solirubrobacteraceae bacterium]
ASGKGDIRVRDRGLAGRLRLPERSRALRAGVLGGPRMGCRWFGIRTDLGAGDAGLGEADLDLLPGELAARGGAAGNVPRDPRRPRGPSGAGRPARGSAPPRVRRAQALRRARAQAPLPGGRLRAGARRRPPRRGQRPGDLGHRAHRGALDAGHARRSGELHPVTARAGGQGRGARTPDGEPRPRVRRGAFGREDHGLPRGRHDQPVDGRLFRPCAGRARGVARGVAAGGRGARRGVGPARPRAPAPDRAPDVPAALLHPERGPPRRHHSHLSAREGRSGARRLRLPQAHFRGRRAPAAIQGPDRGHHERPGPLPRPRRGRRGGLLPQGRRLGGVLPQRGPGARRDRRGAPRVRPPRRRPRRRRRRGGHDRPGRALGLRGRDLRRVGAGPLRREGAGPRGGDHRAGGRRGRRHPPPLSLPTGGGGARRPAGRGLPGRQREVRREHRRRGDLLGPGL